MGKFLIHLAVKGPKIFQNKGGVRWEKEKWTNVEDKPKNLEPQNNQE
jgi:hypothetical protein